MLNNIFSIFKKQLPIKNKGSFEYDGNIWQPEDKVIVISNSNKPYLATIIKGFRGHNNDWSNCFPLVKPFNSDEEYMVMGIIIKYDLKIWSEICDLEAIEVWNKFCRPHARIEKK